MENMIDSEWAIVALPFAIAAMLTPFAAYLSAQWRRFRP